MMTEESDPPRKIPALIQLHSKKLLLLGSNSNSNSNADSKNDNVNNIVMDQMDLATGENWLRLVTRTSDNSNNNNDKPSILDDTQDTSAWRHQQQDHPVPYPSILSGVMPTKLDTKDDNCYLMFDVDDSFGLEHKNRTNLIITVKDMRLPPNSSSTSGGGGSPTNSDSDEDENEEQQPLFDICLARRLDCSEPTNHDNNNNGDASKEKQSLWPGYGPLEKLPRRQLRVLQPGDRICTTRAAAAATAMSSPDHSFNDEQEGDNHPNQNLPADVGLVLEFRMEMPSTTTNNNISDSKNINAADTQASNVSGPIIQDNNNNNNNNNNNHDDDDNTEIEEEPTTTTTVVKAAAATKPTSPLQIMETSSTDDEEEETFEALPALTQPEDMGQPMDSEEEEEEEEEEEGTGRSDNKEEAPPTPSGLMTQPPHQEVDDDGQDSDATDFDLEEQQQQEQQSEQTKQKHEEKSVAKSEGLEKDGEGKTDRTALDAVEKSSSNDQKTTNSDTAKEEEESTEAKTTQETVEGSATNNPNPTAGNSTDKGVKTEMKNVDEKDDSSQETTMEEDEDVNPATSKKKDDDVPKAIETTNANVDDDEATQDVGKDNAKVDTKKDSGNDDDGGVTQEKSTKGDDAMQNDAKKSKDTLPEDDEEATQDVTKKAKEDAPVNENDDDDDDDDDATQDVTKPTKEAAAASDNERDAIQDMSDEKKVAVVEESKKNEETVKDDSESQVKDKAAKDKEAAKEDGPESKETDGVESQGKTRRKSKCSAIQESAPELAEPIDPVKGVSEETTAEEEPLPEITVETKRSSRRKPVKKYGSRFKSSGDDTKEAAKTVDPDSDHSATPQKSPKSTRKSTQKSPEVVEGGDDDNKTNKASSKVVKKGSGKHQQDDDADTKSPPATPPKSSPVASPKNNSSQALKEEGANILASIKQDGSMEETSPDTKDTTKRKPKKAAARVKRKQLEPVTELFEEEIDAAVPESNLKASAPYKGSPDSSSSDPTRKRRSKSRKTEAKTSPTPASASTPAPTNELEPEPTPQSTPEPLLTAETPAKSTRKRKTAQSTSDRKAAPKRTRETPSRAARNDPEEEKEPESNEIRVVTTGVTLSKAQIKFITKKLGGTLLDDVTDAPSATHIIASDKNAGIKRTPKLMICLCTTEYIVGMDWLIESSKANKALPAEDYLLLDDKEAEDRYDFSMQESLERAKEMRQKGEKLLSGWHVHVCKGVSGNKAPPEKEMKLIVEVAGGEWQPTLTPRSLDGVDMSRLLIITSDPEVKKQISTKAVASALENGATKHTTSWLFGCIMKQKLELPEAA